MKYMYSKKIEEKVTQYTVQKEYISYADGKRTFISPEMVNL